MKLGHSSYPLPSGQGDLTRARPTHRSEKQWAGEEEGQLERQRERDNELRSLKHLVNSPLAGEVMTFISVNTGQLALQRSQGTFLHG